MENQRVELLNQDYTIECLEINTKKLASEIEIKENQIKLNEDKFQNASKIIEKKDKKLSKL